MHPGFFVATRASERMYLIEQLATTRPGEPIRLFPYGTITRNGKTVHVTPELARRFKLPHFKPPIKGGSHKDEAPAYGFITSLEPREDGLYAHTEFTEQGAQAWERGDYRYHSPEVVWEGVWGEDATNGEKLEGPLILGLALLHTPALGEAAALYSVQPVTEEIETMSNEQTYTVPAGLWERFTAWFDRQVANEPEAPEPPPAQPSPPAAQEPAAPDALTAALKQRDEQIQQLSAQVDAMKAAQEHAARVAAFAAQLAKTPLAGNAEFHAHLAGLTDEQAAPIVEQITALSAQIDEGALLKSVGSSGKGGGKLDAFEAAVQQAMTERKLTRADAYSALMREQPELFREALDNE